jgi:hypothetical protein
MTFRRLLMSEAFVGVHAILLLAMLGTLFVPAHAAAQAANGTLLGNVRDETGGAVPGATISAIEVRTNISRTAVSNEAGNYIFTNLNPGVYRVEGELAGFRKFARENVEVNVNTTVRVDIGLVIGALNESVTVSSEAPAMQTDRTDTGRIIESTQLVQMPLGFNRNFQGMLITVPGASRPFRPHSEFFNSQDSLSSNVNGQSRLANNVQLEGTDNNHKTGLLTVLIPSAEALETVAVTTSNYDAEFGRAGGAVTNVTLKSGTNDLSGTIFSFGNTEATVARNPFSSLPEPPETTYAQTGFTLGGPIIRNKLFFFGDYVRTHDDSGRITRADLPEVPFRAGDFSAAPTIIYDPLTGNPDGSGRTPFPGNRIPAQRVSPIARRILANIPMPNIDGIALGGTNYEQAYVREKRTNQYDVKLTYQATANDNLSVRYSYQNAATYDPATFGIWGGIKGFAGFGTNPTHNAAANYNRTWTSTLIQEVRVGMSYYHNEAVSEADGLNTSDEVGIRGANLNRFSSGISTIDVSGYNGTLVGFSNSLPWDRSERTWTVATTATKLWGDHTLKVGGDVRYNRDFLLQVQDNGGPRGRFQFRGATTAVPGDTAAQNGFANAFAAFLLDVPQRSREGLDYRRGSGHSPLGRLLVRSRQVAGAAERHHRSGLAPRILHAAGRADESRRTVELRPVQQHAPRVWVQRGSREPRRPKLLEELQPAYRDLLAGDREKCLARRLRGQHDAMARQRLRVQLPGQTEQPDQRAEQLRGGWVDGRRPAASKLRHHPGHRNRAGGALQAAGLLLGADRSERGAAALVERRLSAGLAGRIHRRDCLRRQPGAGHRRAHRPECRLHIGSGEQRPAALCAVRSNRQYDDRHPGEVDVPFDAGESRSPAEKRPARHQFVHAGARLQLLQRGQQRHHLDTCRLRAKLGSYELRFYAQLHEQLRVLVAMGSAGQMASGRRARQGAGRLAALRNFRGHLRHAD